MAPMDGDNMFCGVKNYDEDGNLVKDLTEFPYLMFTGFGGWISIPGESYFSAPTAAYRGMFEKAVCAKKCPESDGDQPDCSKTIANDMECKIDGNPFL